MPFVDIFLTISNTPHPLHVPYYFSYTFPISDLYYIHVATLYLIWECVCDFPNKSPPVSSPWSCKWDYKSNFPPHSSKKIPSLQFSLYPPPPKPFTISPMDKNYLIWYSISLFLLQNFKRSPNPSFSHTKRSFSSP